MLASSVCGGESVVHAATRHTADSPFQSAARGAPVCEARFLMDHSYLMRGQDVLTVVGQSSEWKQVKLSIRHHNQRRFLFEFWNAAEKSIEKLLSKQ